MIINKVFDIILNINNINEIFNKDINSTILNMVKQKYNGRCFLGVYIIDVNRILNRSLIESNQSSLNGSFNIFIQFEGKCILYSPNEIIFNMEVKDTINNIISCTSKNISAIIKLNKIDYNLKKGQIIPIIVGKFKCITGSDVIQINSYPFVPIVNNKKVFYKIGELSEDNITKLNEFVQNYINVEEELKNNILSNINNKWQYFKELMYPFKTNKTDEIINEKNTKYIDLINLKEMNNSIIYLNNEVDLSKRLINVYNTENEINNITEYIKEDDFVVIYDILKKYYLYLQSINQLATIYNTNEKIQQNENIFNLYIKYKK